MDHVDCVQICWNFVDHQNFLGLHTGLCLSQATSCNPYVTLIVPPRSSRYPMYTFFRVTMDTHFEGLQRKINKVMDYIG